MNLIDKKTLKFLAVGILNTIVGAGLMFLLYNCFGLTYWISSACNSIAGGILSYFLNKYFLFLFGIDNDILLFCLFFYN